MKKQVSKRLKTLFTIFISFIALTGILFGYLALIDKRVLQTSRVHMGEMLNQSTVALKNQIISYKKTIEDFSAIISQNHYDQLFLPEFRDELDKSAIISNFSRILVADVNGDCYIKKDKKINLAKRDYFIAALSGKTNISATVAKQQSQYDEVSNCAAPIYDKNSKVCGVLIATLKDSSFESILSASFFGDEGRITVVDDKGNSLFNSNMKNERNGKQEKIDTAILNLDQKSKDSIQEKIKQNNAGILTFKSENETYHMGYAPLFLENWYVNATVNQKTINIKSLAIRKTTMGFLLIFSLFFLALIFYIVTYQNKSREKIDKSKLQLETVIKNIPGGVVRFSTEQDFPIIFLNKGLLKLTGYATDQIATVLDNKFISLVHHEDYERFLKTIDKAKNVKHPVQIDCRIKCNNGGYKWFLLRTCLMKDDNEKSSLLSVLTDIDDMKKTQQELRISLQRYDILMQQSDSLIFEYNFDTKAIYLSEKWPPLKDYNNQDGFINYVIQKKTIYVDDIEKLKEVFADIKHGIKTRRENIRFIDNNGKYPWHQIRVAPVFDDDGIVHKAIGKVRNINVEKLENDKLKETAQLDSLTNLYNKGTTKMLIDDFLENEGRLGKHALFILDIDNFKNVNDTLGHLTGDKVLVDIAEKIKKSVRMTDICGRIGGDEFVILLKNTPSLAFISAKAKEICTSFKSTLSNQTSTVQISGSIGIAPYNADNLAYTELFVNADTALYNSKKNGKNQFSVFNKDTAVGENNPQIKIR